MREIILWYSRNRKTIWKIILISLGVVVGVQLLQWIVVQNQSRNRGNKVVTDKQSNLNTITLKEDKSTITGQSLSTSQTNLLKVIDKFVENCNNNQINEAYDLLSKECKNEMYPTVAEFKEKYYNKIFNGKSKNISAENWVGNIYKIKFKEDALSTGVYNSENTIQDYITVVEDEESNAKLNINGYIGKQKINKQNKENNLGIKVLEKQQYMDFETYVFEIRNNTDSTILLNNINNLDTLYLEDTNGIKYYAYMHELSEAELKVLSGETKKITVKYYNKYSSSKEIKNIVFSKIVLDYDTYENKETMGTIGSYRNYGTLKINL